MRFMNDYDIDRAGELYVDHPILGPAIQTLQNLVDWTNSHSDGWAYWPKPTRAAAKLMEMIQRNGTAGFGYDRERADVTEDEYKKALRPIKAFRTHQNADFEIVEVGEPEEDPVDDTPRVDVSAVETRAEHGREHPTVNIKVHALRSDMEALLPLDLGSVQEPGETEFRTVTTPADFNFAWIDKHLSQQDQETWWQFACEDGFEQAKELAKETFGSHVEVYTEGRSGGWLVVHNLPEIEDWDPGLVSKWVEFAKQVRSIADDVPRSFLWQVHANVYEPWVEAQDEETEYVLTVTTTNPDFKDRVVRAFEQVGLDRSNDGALHRLSATLHQPGGDLPWGTEYDPDEEGNNS